MSLTLSYPNVSRHRKRSDGVTPRLTPRCTALTEDDGHSTFERVVSAEATKRRLQARLLALTEVSRRGRMPRRCAKRRGAGRSSGSRIALESIHRAWVNWSEDEQT